MIGLVLLDWDLPLTKRCTRCLEDLPLNEFHHDSRGGKRPWCKDCFDADIAARRAPGYITLGRASGRLVVPAPVCFCQPALRGGDCGSCRGCGLPIVGLMAERPGLAAYARWPELHDQRIQQPRPARTAS